jgi:hypothetical protein
MPSIVSPPQQVNPSNFSDDVNWPSCPPFKYGGEWYMVRRKGWQAGSDPPPLNNSYMTVSKSSDQLTWTDLDASNRPNVYHGFKDGAAFNGSNAVHMVWGPRTVATPTFPAVNSVTLNYGKFDLTTGLYGSFNSAGPTISNYQESGSAYGTPDLFVCELSTGAVGVVYPAHVRVVGGSWNNQDTIQLNFITFSGGIWGTPVVVAASGLIGGDLANNQCIGITADPSGGVHIIWERNLQHFSPYSNRFEFYHSRVASGVVTSTLLLGPTTSSSGWISVGQPVSVNGTDEIVFPLSDISTGEIYLYRGTPRTAPVFTTEDTGLVGFTVAVLPLGSGKFRVFHTEYDSSSPFAAQITQNDNLSGSWGAETVLWNWAATAPYWTPTGWTANFGQISSTMVPMYCSVDGLSLVLHDTATSIGSDINFAYYVSLAAPTPTASYAHTRGARALA